MKKRVYKKSSKPGVPCKADCKGSNFRGLHKETVSYLLNEMANKSLPLHKLNATCQEMKKIQGLKKMFLELFGVSTWEEAQANYPEFAIKK